MSDVVWTAEEIEKNRQEAIQEFIENHDYEEGVTAETITRDNQPGTYNCHESLDNCSKLMNSVAELMQHGSIISNPEWFTLAHNAHTLLFNLYQEIGATHLELIPDNINELIEAKKAKFTSTT